MDTVIAVLIIVNVVFSEEFIVRFRETGIADKCVKYRQLAIEYFQYWLSGSSLSTYTLYYS